MWISMKMGLRNLRRHPGRTASTLSMLLLGTLLIVFSTGANEGPYNDMVRVGTGMWNGHIQVMHEGYKKSPSLFKTVSGSKDLIAKLDKTPQVAATTARVEVSGLLSVANRTAGVSMVGVMPAREAKVSSLPGTLKQGTFLTQPADPEAYPIILGKGLAYRLRAKLGDEVVFMGQAADGSTAAEIFILGGIVESGIDELDASLAWIRLNDAQTLLELGTRVHQVVIKLDDVYTAEAFVKQHGHLAQGKTKFYAWTTLMPGLWASIESDRAGGMIFTFVILLVVALGTINTLLMAVFERTRELGVIKALGASQGHMISMIAWESFWLALFGVGVGALLGIGLNEYFANVGIKMFDEPMEMGGMKLSVIYTKNTIRGSLIYPTLIFLSAFIGSLWPAIRAARLNVTDALRHV